MKTLIYNGDIICDGNRTISDGYILFDESGIITIDNENLASYYNDAQIEKIDAQGNWVTPGLTDIHNHGALGYDFASASVAELQLIATSLIAEGVTGFLASVAPESRQEMLASAKRLGTYRYQSGAACLGIHMEGPYLSEKYRALMRLEYLRSAEVKEFLQWQEVSADFVKTITIAPEVRGAINFIAATKGKVRCLLGHTDASVAMVQAAVANGAVGLTHLYNAMSQHLHRQPGVVTAGFLEEGLLCELICDGMHVAQEVVQMTIKQMTPKRVILVSDAMPGKGLADGRFLFCGNWVYKENGITHLENDTRIAGSIMPLNQMCLNVLQWCACSISDIVQMACVNPNKLLNEDRKGSLEVGKDADICIFDYNMNPQNVFVQGTKQK